MSRELRLLCDANPMCFGSTTAMLAILDGVTAHCAALADAPNQVLLRSDDAVDEVLGIGSKDPSALAALLRTRAFDAVLVVSNRANADVYRTHGLPVFFVDILPWMERGSAHPIWEIAERAFIEEFPGVEEGVARGWIPAKAERVGPLIREVPRTAVSRGTLVNLGGGHSRLVTPGVDSRFARQVIDWLRRVPLSPNQHPVLMASGELAVRDAAEFAQAAGFALQTLSQREFVAALGATELFVTVPGLNAVHEGLWSGKPMLFLPPQNATQVWQLEVYERHGLVQPGLALSMLDDRFDRDALRNSEESLTRAVLASLSRLSERPEVCASIAKHIEVQLRDWSVRREAFQRFAARLGRPGASRVSEAIRSWSADRSMSA